MAYGDPKDPTYLGYLRALGMNEDVARSAAARNLSSIQRQVQTMTPEIARLGVLSRRGIGDSFEARGVYRSGMRQQRQAEQGAGEAYQVGQVQGQAADRNAGVVNTLETTLADLARQRADRAAMYGVGV